MNVSVQLYLKIVNFKITLTCAVKYPLNLRLSEGNRSFAGGSDGFGKPRKKNPILRNKIKPILKLIQDGFLKFICQIISLSTDLTSW